MVNVESINIHSNEYLNFGLWVGYVKENLNKYNLDFMFKYVIEMKRRQMDYTRLQLDKDSVMQKIGTITEHLELLKKTWESYSDKIKNMEIG